MNVVQAWAYQTLVGDPGYAALVAGGTFESSAMETVPEEKPYAIHSLGRTIPLLKTEGIPPAQSTPFRLYVHDEPGTYERILEVLELSRALLVGPTTFPFPGLVSCRWEGDSPQIPTDLQTGTISMFATFRVTYTRGEQA